MRTFELHRDEDETGVSGTGVVAQGVVFDDGPVALRWIVGEHRSTVVWASIDAVEAIHGHGGRTRIVWTEPLPEYIDEDAQGWWHPDDGMGVRADPTGGAQHRRVYIFGLTGGADVSLSPLMARRIGRALIAAAEYAGPGGSQ